MKKILVLLAFAGSIHNVCAMSVGSAWRRTLGTAAVVGVGSGLRYMVKLADYNEKPYKNPFYKPLWENYVLITAVSTGIAGFLSARRTPKGLLRRANGYMGKRDQNVLKALQETGGKKTQFVPWIRNYYVRHPYAFSSAFKECTNIYDNSIQARNLAVQAVAVEQMNPETQKALDSILKELRDDEYWKNLQQAMKALKGDKRFLEQMNAKSLKDSAEAAEANALANSVNALANATRGR